MATQSPQGCAAIINDYYRSVVSGRSRGLWPGLLRWGLRTASVPYDIAARLRNRLYEQGLKQTHRVNVPVVSIGNLTMGGTGKTPCVEYVARRFHEQGRRTAILSRGYGSQRGRNNDEAMLLADNLPGVPHLQGRDRVALALAAVTKLKSEVLVLDDGFQHRRLARDLDIVLIDATDPWGHGFSFPRGLLREPLAGLSRAGVVILTRCDLCDRLERGRLREAIAQWAIQAPVAEARHAPVDLVNVAHETAPLDSLRRRSVAAFCGIGNPESFRRTLAKLGVVVGAFRTFPDHHAYAPGDLDDLADWAGQQESDCLILTTQKDLVKLRQTELDGRALWALRIRLQFEAGEELLQRKLQEVLQKKG